MRITKITGGRLPKFPQCAKCFATPLAIQLHVHKGVHHLCMRGFAPSNWKTKRAIFDAEKGHGWHRPSANEVHRAQPMRKRLYDTMLVNTLTTSAEKKLEKIRNDAKGMRR